MWRDHVINSTMWMSGCHLKMTEVKLFVQSVNSWDITLPDFKKKEKRNKKSPHIDDHFLVKCKLTDRKERVMHAFKPITGLCFWFAWWIQNEDIDTHETGFKKLQFGSRKQCDVGKKTVSLQVVWVQWNNSILSFAVY